MELAYDTTAVTREFDGEALVFQRYDDLWMIDRVQRPANDQGDEDDDFDDELARELECCTAVARHELTGLSEAERRRFHARQLRRLGLSERGECARLLWAMILDFEHFAP